MEMSAPTRKRRRFRTVLIRTLLSLGLLSQLLFLWALHRPSPTAIPTGLAEALAEATLDSTLVDIDRATVDRRGVIRLQGVRLTYPASRRFGGAAEVVAATARATVDAEIFPPWREWARLRAGSPRVRAQGRLATAGWGGEQSLLDRLDLRMAADGSVLLVANAAGFHIRASVAGTPEGGAGPAETLDRQGDRLRPILDALALLRSFEGGAELRASGQTLRVEASGRLRPGASLRAVELAGWRVPAGAGEFALTAQLDEQGADLRLRADDLRLGELRVGGVALEIGRKGDFSLAAQEVSLSGMDKGAAAASGSLRQGPRSGQWSMLARASASLGDSRVAGLLRMNGAELEISELNLSAAARDLNRLPGIGDQLRSAGVDFAGRAELIDSQAVVRHGQLIGGSGWFALTGAGWGDIRPSAIRPERPAAALSGKWSLNPRPGVFLLSELDLAGLRGSIGGGLSKGEDYEVRLSSSPGNPVHPGCLNSLLGEWWIDLWQRFDLSTGGAAPHADVRVRGKWGEAQAERVEVSASLESFGFMGARFSSTEVRVAATPAETLVWIDRLEGLIDGKPAGAARGRLRWDWRNPAWEGRPEIEAEGDIEPACVLRLHDAAMAQRLRGWSLGSPWTKVRITPGKDTTVDLSTSGPSRIAGMDFGPLRLQLAQPAQPDSPLLLSLGAAFAGGRLEIDLQGNLRDQNDIRRLALIDVWWADLQKAVPGLFGEPKTGETPDPSSLAGEFQGRINLEDPSKAAGSGRFLLKDPRLKTIHLLGGVSEALSKVGIDFSTYPLTEAEGVYSLEAGKAKLTPLRLRGQDAVLELRGLVDLESGKLSLKGDFKLRKSPWGILGYINPNRLIAKILKIEIGGTLKNPEAKAETLPF